MQLPQWAQQCLDRQSMNIKMKATHQNLKKPAIIIINNISIPQSLINISNNRTQIAWTKKMTKNTKRFCRWSTKQRTSLIGTRNIRYSGNKRKRRVMMIRTTMIKVQSWWGLRAIKITLLIAILFTECNLKSSSLTSFMIWFLSLQLHIKKTMMTLITWTTKRMRLVWRN